MTDEVASFNDHELRLYEMGGTFIAVQVGEVNIDDLLNMRPGSIIRCSSPPADCIKVHAYDARPLGVVAGWISEDDQ